MRINNYPFQSKISKDQIYSLPLIRFTGKIIYVDSGKKLKPALNYLANESILGFDTETKPSFKKGVKNKVALLQLAGENTAVLIRLNKVGLKDGLIDILTDSSILKVGVALHDDIKILNKIHSFDPGSFIDLQQHVKKFGIEDNSLKKLAANILKFRISKQQQTSNWENPELTPAQIEYAALDAWVCYMIYKKLNEFTVHEQDQGYS